ncbi:hypothetical protein DLM85_09680 [Hymenobacter edaphi]|uniref:Uncharacterized protein n=2 Tax=Hymenobacter edaphi TaxID=2211146 RepID=A0A328BQK9_9BACT|nr:hypothetical protein DLM85_09680 [Hymenobacter edaphi]
MDWYVDVRRPDVCLHKLVSQNNFGLFYIISPLSSHWTTCYFINGSRGVSVIRWTGAGQTEKDVRKALDRHREDLGATQADSILHYFDK